jgi:hypothetical protein
MFLYPSQTYPALLHERVIHNEYISRGMKVSGGETLFEMYGLSQAPVAHTYNPSCSGGRDQEDGTSKSARANSSQTPILEILNT